MTVIESVHRELGATFREVEGVRVVDHYGRPERAHLATRNAAGLVEPAYAVLEVARDRRAALAATLTTELPEGDGRAAYGRLADDTVRGEATVLVAEDRLLCLVSPGARGWLTDRVDATDRTDDLAVFGVHGPQATEKVAGVLHGAGTPEGRLAFTRGRMDDAGVTVLRTDDPAGEEGYEVVCAAEHARGVHDTLLVRGPNAAPVGHRTWGTLTLEAGTPLSADLAGLAPAALRADAPPGTPRFVGLAPESLPATGDPLALDGRRVGQVVRAVESPSLERPIALALVTEPDGAALAADSGGAVDPDDLAHADDPADADDPTLTVETADGPVAAAPSPLPFLEGSAASGRVPPTGTDLI